MWTPIIEELTNNQHFIISSHLSPDCDALGSELALAYHLQSLGKTVSILNTDPVPSAYKFLDPDNLIDIYSGNNHLDVITQAQVIIVVDASGGWTRLGRVGKALSKAKATTICIDHHPNGEPFTDFSVVDTGAAAAAELVFDLILAMDGAITLPIANALYAGIITDSGNFRFSSTTPRTHHIAAQLIEAGTKPVEIYNKIYEQYPINRLHLQGHVLQNIKLAAAGKIAYVSLSKATLKQFDIPSSELDGFSGMAKAIKGVKMAIFLVELPRNRVKISLRSDGDVPVNGLAAQFGGGGHIPAAGAVAQGSLESVEATILKKAETLF